MPFIATSHGLVAQAIQDAASHDFNGRPHYWSAWPRAWGAGQFSGFRNADGQTIDSRNGGIGPHIGVWG